MVFMDDMATAFGSLGRGEMAFPYIPLALWRAICPLLGP